MSKDWLATDVPDSRLDEIYGDEQYYAYMKSVPFRLTFLKRVGDVCAVCGGPVLDVGCGEGWLADYVPPDVRYVGIDGSATAIRTAGRLHLGREFHKVRFEDLEDPDMPVGEFRTVVFGGMLDVLVKPGRRLEVLESYREKFGAEFIVVYDLARLDTSPFRKRYGLVASHEVRIDPSEYPELADIPPVKLWRKIEVYKC